MDLATFMDDAELGVVVAKLLLAVLAVAFFVYFYWRWVKVKSGLPMMQFYSKWKIVNNNLMIGVGMAALALGFVIEFLYTAGFLNPGCLACHVAAGLLEAAGLACMTFSFYRIMRLELPHEQKPDEREEKLEDALRKIDSELLEAGKGIKRKKKKKG